MAKGIPLMGRDPDGKAKMINVDENGNVKVQQVGTTPQIGKDILPLHTEIGVVPAGGTKTVVVDISNLGFPAEAFSILVRNPEGGLYSVFLHYKTFGSIGYITFGSGRQSVIESSSATTLDTGRLPLLGKAFQVNVRNDGDTDFSFAGFTLFLWSTLGEKISDNMPPPALYGATIAQRPPAGSVKVGTTFTLTNSNLDTWISDGTNWVEV